jgi:hypothetical protein
MTVAIHLDVFLCFFFLVLAALADTCDALLPFPAYECRGPLAPSIHFLSSKCCKCFPLSCGVIRTVHNFRSALVHIVANDHLLLASGVEETGIRCVWDIHLRMYVRERNLAPSPLPLMGSLEQTTIQRSVFSPFPASAAVKYT